MRDDSVIAMCALCKRRDAVYMRIYSGERLCSKCFTRSIENKVKGTIARNRMFKPDDRIAVAVSGGKDSISLLHILAKFEKLFPKASLCAVTVDEGIRGYREEAVRLARENCQKLGIEHFMTSFKDQFDVRLDELVTRLKDKCRTSVETLLPCAYCGVLRRRALNVVARQAKADKLALAHNLDDEAQTILLNIMHGDARRIARVRPVLGKSHPMFVPRVKPLCEVPEKEIAFYAYLKKTEFQSTPCPYALTAMRSDIRLMLNRFEERHAGTKYTIFRSVERIRPILEGAEKEIALQACKECGEPTVGDSCKPCEMLRKIGVK